MPEETPRATSLNRRTVLLSGASLLAMATAAANRAQALVAAMRLGMLGQPPTERFQ